MQAAQFEVWLHLQAALILSDRRSPDGRATAKRRVLPKSGRRTEAIAPRPSEDWPRGRAPPLLSFVGFTRLCEWHRFLVGAVLAADVGSGRVPYEVSEPWEYLPSVLHPSLGAADDPLARIGSARWVTAMPPPRHLGAHTVILLYTEVCFWATGPAHVGDFSSFLSVSYLHR